MKKVTKCHIHFFKTELVLYLGGTDNQFVLSLVGASNLSYFSLVQGNQHFLLFSVTANRSRAGLWGRIISW